MAKWSQPRLEPNFPEGAYGFKIYFEAFSYSKQLETSRKLITIENRLFDKNIMLQAQSTVR